MLTVRVSPDLMAKAARRAAELGLDRGTYVRSLIEEDVTTADRPKQRVFASEDFIGSVPLGLGPYVNRRVRELVRRRLTGHRETDR